MAKRWKRGWTIAGRLPKAGLSTSPGLHQGLWHGEIGSKMGANRIARRSSCLQGSMATKQAAAFPQRAQHQFLTQKEEAKWISKKQS
jgi:hypothetical protein